MAEPRDYEQDILRRFDNWSVYLHEDQSYLGRSYIALSRGGDNEEMDPFIDTYPEEQEEFHLIVRGLKTVLDELYSPTRLNYANLRNTWHHNHWHVIPRYEGHDSGLRIVNGFEFRDLNPGKNYAPSPKVLVPTDVIAQIQSDMTAGLASVEVG